MDSASMKKKLMPRVMVIITKPEDRHKIERLLEAEGIPIWQQLRGQGTAPNEILNIFGFGGTTRIITFCCLPRVKILSLFFIMASRLSFLKKGGGVAFSVPVNGVQHHVVDILTDEAASVMDQDEGTNYMEHQAEAAEKVLIFVSVNAGYSDDAVEAARQAGARGGTVIKGRRCNSDRVGEMLNLSNDSEQDIVLLVVNKDSKSEIMEAITKACGLHTKAHGIVITVPVEDAVGLR